MTAEEIRKSLFEFQQGMQDAVKEDVKAAMQSVPAAAIGKIPLYLGEIAAQLAELNAKLDKVVFEGNEDFNSALRVKGV